MVISCNPDPDHQIKNMIQWYLDEDGYPIPEKDGVIRWFVTIDGEYFWGDTREELLKKYNTGKRKVLPQQNTLIAALEDPIHEPIWEPIRDPVWDLIWTRKRSTAGRGISGHRIPTGAVT